MSDALITYDVSSKQIEMKERLKVKGYMDRWLANGRTYYLPNTTLWKQNTTAEQGKSDMIEVANYLRINLERAIVVPTSPWSGIEGRPHS